MSATPEVAAVDGLYDKLFEDVDALLNGTLDKPEEESAPAATVEAVEPVTPVVAERPESTATSSTTAKSVVNDEVANQIDALARVSLDKADLERRLQAREAELEALKKPAAVAAPDFFEGLDLDLTADEQEAYADNLPVLQKVFNQALKNYDSKRVSKLLEDVSSVRGRLGDVDALAGSAALDAFALAVNTAMPELGRKMRTAEWQAHMKKVAPYSGGKATLQDLWNYAEQNRDINAMYEIAKDVAIAQDPTLASPGSAVAPAPSSPAPRPRMMPYSDYTKALQKHAAGTLSYEAFSKIQDAFFTAEAAGLVDEDA